MEFFTSYIYLTGIFEIYLFSTRTDWERTSCLVFLAIEIFLSLLALLDLLLDRSGSAFLFIISRVLWVITLTYDIVGLVVLVLPLGWFCSWLKLLCLATFARPTCEVLFGFDKLSSREETCLVGRLETELFRDCWLLVFFITGPAAAAGVDLDALMSSETGQ